MESFIENLINIKLLKEGILAIEKEQFNPQEVFDFILNMFSLKAES